MYPIVPVTQRLQDGAVDVIKAFDEVNMCICALQILNI